MDDIARDMIAQLKRQHEGVSELTVCSGRTLAPHAFKALRAGLLQAAAVRWAEAHGVAGMRRGARARRMLARAPARAAHTRRLVAAHARLRPCSQTR